MTTLVTGGTGLLGINVVRQLCASGERVRALVRPSKKPRVGLSDLDLEIVAGDVTDAESVRNAMKGVSKVYHIAALTWQGPWESVRRQLQDVNVAGTETVCRLAAEAGVSRLVHTSSTVAIGWGTKDHPADENTPWNLQGLGPYYDTKREAEDAVRKYVAQGLDAVIVNPGFMLGPWDVKPTSGTVIIQAARSAFGIPIYTAGGNNVCDVEDVARGHLLAMERGRTGERYVLANENMTYREFFTAVNQACGKPPPRMGLHPRMTAPLGPLLDAVGYFFPEAMDNYNSSTLRSGSIGLYASSEKAKRELGYATRPVSESIQNAIAWFKQHGYLV